MGLNMDLRTGLSMETSPTRRKAVAGAIAFASAAPRHYL